MKIQHTFRTRKAAVLYIMRRGWVFVAPDSTLAFSPSFPGHVRELVQVGKARWAFRCGMVPYSQTRNQADHDQQTRERLERLKPATVLLATEALKMMGNCGPAGITDRLTQWTHRAEYGLFEVVVTFNFRKP